MSTLPCKARHNTSPPNRSGTKRAVNRIRIQCGACDRNNKDSVFAKTRSAEKRSRAQKQLAGIKEDKGFRWELASSLNGNLNLPSNMANLEKEMEAEYEQKDNWREGKLKSSFNYILLDPRVSNNLPLRCASMTELGVFTSFVSAIFYIGKGKRNRPYAHFNEALHALRDKEKQPSQKISHILDIWQEGHGVVSPAEAYTREACTIDAIGLQRLTNSIKGNFYGQSSSWRASRQRLMGVYLLKKACEISFWRGSARSAQVTSKKYDEVLNMCVNKR